MSQRANGNRWERNRYYQIRDGHRNRHSDKEYKRESNRTERHTISQLCHQACLDSQVDVHYNKRADWDSFMPHGVPYYNYWYTRRPVWMRRRRPNYPQPTLTECRHLPQWMQHQIQQSEGKCEFYINRDQFDEDKAEAKRIAWRKRYPDHPGAACDCRSCEFQKKHPLHPGVRCRCDTCMWRYWLVE